MEQASLYRPEPLGNGVSAVISPAHGFGTDALLLARFAQPHKQDFACDLCSGCGIIPLLWCRDGRAAKITAVELQKEACGQLEQAVAYNNLSEKLEVVQADLRCLDGVLPMGVYDLVTANPPYQASGSGFVNREASAAVARHEQMCTFSQVCEAGVKLLRFGGKLAVCCRPERLFSLMLAMHEAGAEPKRLLFVAKNPESPPWLSLVQAKRGAKPGLIAEATLFLYGSHGEFSARAQEWYGAYAPGKQDVKGEEA